jgi:hypothetical protein
MCKDKGYSELFLNYAYFMNSICNLSIEQTISALSEELPYVWLEEYTNKMNSDADVSRIKINSFEYFFDTISDSEYKTYESEHKSVAPRLIGVIGRSKPKKTKRDDYRLHGWVGPTEKYFGKEWDKGHFIAHSIGGAVKGSELNVFIQRRDLNRGWSEQGKIFCEMEKYCKNNKNTFCFNRPLYIDETDRPAFYEYGVLKPDKELWVEIFDNR